MGSEDMRRQALNVFRMQLLGAKVKSVDNGSRNSKGRDQMRHDAIG